MMTKRRVVTISPRRNNVSVKSRIKEIENMSLKEFEHIVDKETNPKGDSKNGQKARKRKMQTRENDEVQK